MMNPRVLPLFLIGLWVNGASPCMGAEPPVIDAEALAKQVTIYRDEWGVAHILGETDAATLFGTGYAQAEDNFWQIEDNCVRGLGRYAELYGESGLRNDLLNRAFEVPQRSKADFLTASPDQQLSVSCYAAGVNAYLESHPEVRPRLIERFEPWYVIAIDRHFILDFAYGRVHAGRPKAEQFEVRGVPEPIESADVTPAWQHMQAPEATLLEQQAMAAIGSNEWSIAPAKTKDGRAMLFVNPHQPWYGWGQFFEFHIHSEESLRFSGAGFLGNPIPSIGHNDHLGWTYTVNDPDIADAWEIEFSPDNPLSYKHGDDVKQAVRWQDTIVVKSPAGPKSRTFEFMKTHHGPIVSQRGPHKYVAAQIANLFSLERGEQAFAMIRAKNFVEWKAAVSKCGIPMFNISYADLDGNIFYAYNGAIPIRSQNFDWQKPVDGNDPSTDWRGIHPFDELPQVLNPPSNYVQNCNSSPFTTTDDGNPSLGDFPAYMVEDKHEDKRRAKISRKLLREVEAIDFEQFQALAFDTRLYWPMTEVPRFMRDLERLESVDPERAERVRPLLEHLAKWDFRATADSTQTALCLAWYEELYGLGYPAETIKPEFRGDRLKCLDALVVAAKTTKRLHGTWQVRWGDIHRLQRAYKKSSVTQAALAFNRFKKSYEMAGAPGPLGVVFTVYSTPSVPLIRPERYGVVGACYVAAIEFGPKIRTGSITPYGCRANPRSPNAFDQSKLFAQGKFKQAWYYPEEVKAHASSSYHPMTSAAE